MTPDVTWHSFDPQEPGSPPPALDGTAAVAVVPSGDPQWAAAAAVGLARSLARSGRRVFLCDADIEDPRLHGFFEGDFGEGVSDLVLYGASPRRVAREVEDRLLFVAAGTTVADAARVHSSPRWDSLVDAVAQADGLLVLHLPAGGEGADALLARAERIVLVGDPGASPDLGEAAERLVAGFHPVGTEPAPAAAPAIPHATEPGSEAVHSLPGEVPHADAPGAPAGTRSGPPPREVHLPSGSEVETPTTAGGDVLDDPRVRDAVARARSGGAPASSGAGGARTLVLLVLLIVVAVLAAAWFGLISIPGITPAQADPVSAEAVVPPAAVAPETPADVDDSDEGAIGPLNVWNLMLGSFTDPATARGLAEEIGATHGGLALAVAPVEIGGTVYHRVLAGPMPDSVDAVALRTLLSGQTDQGGEWIVQAAPLSFMAGETPERAAAERRREVLLELGIPAHVLSLERRDGSRLYRVYVGAYGDADEASFMAQRLAERNVDNAPLVERRGTPPA